MKKILMMFAIASFLVSFVACGGDKKASTEGTEEITVVEETTETLAGDEDFLVGYEKFVDKAIESGLYEKVLKGDVDATQEWTKLAEDFSKLSQDASTQVANFTPEQIQKLTEISEKWAKYLQNAAGQ
ncbi:MAG: hypothetical protein LBU22_13545 [Dysgonamonadaceae bacterium]|jgi:hypothetical protein|nr:hypothetical protein [Dysgonamonadaceae bacterium]